MLCVRARPTPLTFGDQAKVPAPLSLQTPSRTNQDFSTMTRTSLRQTTGSLRKAVSVVCATRKQSSKRKPGKKKSSAGGNGFASDGAAALQFQNLMYVWDDVFEYTCMSSERVLALAECAERGFDAHGPGCLYVRAEVVGRFQNKKGGKGSRSLNHMMAELSTEGEVLGNNPDYMVTSWSVVFVPAPLISQLGGLTIAGEGIPVPASEQLIDLTPDDVATAGADVVYEAQLASADEGVAFGLDADTVGELRRSMRGMDTSRLLTLLGLATADPAMASVGGEDPYNPEAGEVVVLLSTKIDKQPMIGADKVVGAMDEDTGHVVFLTPGMSEWLESMDDTGMAAAFA